VCRVGADEAAHARARRLRPGDAVVLVDGSGREARGRVVRLARGALEVSVEALRAPGPPAHPSVHLLVAAVRSERLSWIVEKATELAASRVTLVVSERTQSFRARDTIAARLSRVAREAAKQSETARWPAVEGPFPLSEVLRSETSSTRLILDPSGEPFPATLSADPAALLVGPEGGWTERELAAALAAGWLAVSLAAGKLRAETAAVAGLALARAALARVPH
jgi:16S rRNA (uracil1498-N3)-methyltransferase